jgi:hypothetical protein
MSAPTVLYSSTGEAVYMSPNYIRYGNRIMDASFVATVTVKKNRILFNAFKENTTLPTFAIPFKKESDARHALNKCCEFYEINTSNPNYDEDDDIVEVYLPDAYGGIFTVTPDYLKYRDRVIGTEEVRTVQVKGKRVVINRFKGNHIAPTMCVHFVDKGAALHALNTIHSVLWNINASALEDTEDTEDVKPDVVLEDDTNPQDGRFMIHVKENLGSPIDPDFLVFMKTSTIILFLLVILRYSVGNVSSHYDEL